MGAKDDILTQFDRGGVALPLACQAVVPAAEAETTDLLVSCPPADYSASALARAVEDCDAHITFLRLLPDREEGRLLVAIRVNRIDGIAVARSLERYGFTVESIRGQLGDGMESLSQRAREVMRYLEM